MTWRLPFVGREAYEERGRRVADAEELRGRLLDTIDDLRTELARMRRDGFIAAKPAVVRQAPDEERQALERAEQSAVAAAQRRSDEEFIARAVARIKRDNPDLSDAAARAEAIRLRRSVTDEDPPS